MNLEPSPQAHASARWPRWLWIAAGFILAAHVAVELVHQLIHDVPCLWRERFDPSENESIGAAFVAGLLVLSGVCAMLNARRLAGASIFRRALWLLLGLALVAAAVSKLTELHRHIDLPTDGFTATRMLALAGLIAAGFVPWFLSLAPRIRVRLAAAAAIYLTGAIAIDWLSTFFPESLVDDACGNQINGLGYSLMAALESAFETAGFVLLATTLGKSTLD